MKREKVSTSQKIIVSLLAVFILVPGFFGFGDKLYQFFYVLKSDSEGRFALVPILAYIIISFGFLFIMIWGAMKGMLSDIEGPKYQMLEREEMLEAQEGSA